MKDNAVLENVLRYMVTNARDGVFEGSPREMMEDLDVSSGPLYHALYECGLRRTGRGRKAKWTIPQHIIDRYKD